MKNCLGRGGFLKTCACVAVMMLSVIAWGNCNADKIEKFRMRAAFLDLGRQMETVDFIKDYVDFIADSGLNALCLYFEGRLKTPTTQALPDAGSYSREDVSAISAKARARGVELIPALEVLGHAEHFFRDGKLRHLSEERDGDGRWGGKAACGTFCPSSPESRAFIARFLSEAAAMFPDSRLVMVGLDEPWNMGFCKLCRERRRTEGFGGIFARHVDFVHDVLAKAGKTMYMFDDFYEFFPERLAECPKDVWMSSWTYDRDVSRWGHRGHFAQRIRIDFLRRYRELGIKSVPACSTWFDYHNIRTLSEYAEAAGCEGMTFTHWGVDDRLYGQYAPVVAAAGAYWSSPDSFVASDFARTGLERVFPKLSAAEVDAIAPALHIRLYMPQTSVEGTLNLAPRPDLMIAMEAAIAAFMRSAYAPGEAVAPRAMSPEALADDFVCQLRLAVAREKLRLIGPELASPRRESSRVATARADLERVRADLSSVAARRRMQHAVWRKGCYPDEMARHVEKSIALCDRLSAMPESPAEDEWWLEIGLSMPEYHMSPRWIVKAEKDGEWRVIADGRWKAEMRDWANFEHVVPFKMDWRPKRLRVEYRGYGPCSMNCVALFNRDVRLVPKAIAGTEGLVRNPENLLVDNWKPASFGWPDTMEVFHNPELGGVVSAVELELRGGTGRQ